MSITALDQPLGHHRRRWNAGELQAVGREDDLGFYSDEAILTAPRVRHVHRAVDREGAYTRDETALFICRDD